MNLGPGDILVAFIASCELRRREPLFWARLHFPERLRHQAALAPALFVGVAPDDDIAGSDDS